MNDTKQDMVFLSVTLNDADAKQVRGLYATILALRAENAQLVAERDVICARLHR